MKKTLSLFLTLTMLLSLGAIFSVAATEGTGGGTGGTAPLPATNEVLLDWNFDDLTVGTITHNNLNKSIRPAVYEGTNALTGRNIYRDYMTGYDNVSYQITANKELRVMNQATELLTGGDIPADAVYYKKDVNYVFDLLNFADFADKYDGGAFTVSYDLEYYIGADTVLDKQDGDRSYAMVNILAKDNSTTEDDEINVGYRATGKGFLQYMKNFAYVGQVRYGSVPFTSNMLLGNNKFPLFNNGNNPTEDGLRHVLYASCIWGSRDHYQVVYDPEAGIRVSVNGFEIPYDKAVDIDPLKVQLVVAKGTDVILDNFKVTTGAPAEPELLITEIAAGGTQAAGNAFEYIELYNASDKELNIYDYVLMRRTRQDAAENGSTITHTLADSTKTDYAHPSDIASTTITNNYLNAEDVLFIYEGSHTFESIKLKSNKPEFTVTHNNTEEGTIQPGEVCYLWVATNTLHNSGWRTPTTDGKSTATLAQFREKMGLLDDTKAFVCYNDYNTSLANSGDYYYGIAHKDAYMKEVTEGEGTEQVTKLVPNIARNSAEEWNTVTNTNNRFDGVSRTFEHMDSYVVYNLQNNVNDNCYSTGTQTTYYVFQWPKVPLTAQYEYAYEEGFRRLGNVIDSLEECDAMAADYIKNHENVTIEVAQAMFRQNCTVNYALVEQMRPLTAIINGQQVTVGYGRNDLTPHITNPENFVMALYNSTPIFETYVDIKDEGVTITTISMAIEMLDGAALVLDTGATLQFQTAMNKADYEVLKGLQTQGLIKSFEFGTIVIPTKSISITDKPTLETEGIAKFAADEGDFILTDLYTKHNVYAANYGVTSQNYNVKYGARGYISITFANDVVQNFYTDFSRTNNVRTAAAVAKCAVMDQTAAWTAAELAILNPIADEY